MKSTGEKRSIAVLFGCVSLNTRVSILGTILNYTDEKLNLLNINSIRQEKDRGLKPLISFAHHASSLESAGKIPA